MNYIVFDIETRTASPGFGENAVKTLEVSVVGIYDSSDDTYTSYIQEELSKLWPRIEKTEALIGFNSNSFDIPILNKYYPGDLTHIKSIDLLVSVQESLGRRLRLQTIAEATLGASKSSHGLQAVEWWQQGRVDEIREYCLQDVKLTKEIFDYALAHKKLKYKDLNQIKEISINTSSWKEDGKTPSLTHTLGI